MLNKAIGYEKLEAKIEVLFAAVAWIEAAENA